MINSLAKGLEKLAMLQSESLLEAECLSLSLSRVCQYTHHMAQWNVTILYRKRKNDRVLEARVIQKKNVIGNSGPQMLKQQNFSQVI